MKDQQAAFVVIEDGKRYEIFRDGHVTGFKGESVVVINFIPHFEKMAVLMAKEQMAQQSAEPASGQ